MDIINDCRLLLNSPYEFSLNLRKRIILLLLSNTLVCCSVKGIILLRLLLHLTKPVELIS